MLIATLLLVAVDDAKAALDRFAALVQRNPTMAVDIQVQLENYAPVGRGQFSLSKPDKLNLRVDWGQHSYEFGVNGPRRIEVDHFEKQYQEYRDYGPLLPRGEISMTPTYAFPSVFITGDLRHLAPTGTKFKAGQKVVQGSSVLTPLSAQFSTQSGTAQILAYVDQNGKLTSLKTDLDDDDGHKVWTISFSNYRLGNASSTFNVNPPKGYSPDRVQTPEYALEMGSPFPAKDWRNVANGAALSSMKGKPFLAVFVRPNCEPSKAAMKELATISASIAKSGVQTVLMVQGTKANAQEYVAKFPKFYAATPAAQQELRLPGSPTFFLIDKQGLLNRLWYGFDRDQPSQYTNDIIASAKALK
ncbi:MAG: hypothetical protein KF784_03645 [Fimbriimonadaceae bacterium]|nr:hypothetical protein [Fimbriimonadaceae bacterium]